MLSTSQKASQDFPTPTSQPSPRSRSSGSRGPSVSTQQFPPITTLHRAYSRPFLAAVHLLWILVQEENAWLDAEADVLVQWPSRAAAAYTPPPGRRFPSDKRISAKIIAVQHGSPPELWTKKNVEKPRAEATVTSPQPVKPAYDPRVRQIREPPPVMTSRYQWYITPGEAM